VPVSVGLLLGERPGLALPVGVPAPQQFAGHRGDGRRGAVRRRPARGARAARGGLAGASLPAYAFVGLADVAANGSYAVAAQHGPVTVAAVPACLYPVVTALAARGFLRERLRPVQAAGAGPALVGTLLPATG
jgi:drug/metabolite transporter (DMT)-like permease